MTMQKPQLFNTPFASGGSFTPLPLTTSTTVANQILGFPPLQATPYSAGGLAVNISQMNGILNSYSTSLVWLQGGGTYTYEPTWVTATGGYDSGTILWYALAKRYVISLVNNNNNNFLITPGLIDGTHWQYLDVYSSAANFPDITDTSNTVTVTGTGGLAVTHSASIPTLAVRSLITTTATNATNVAAQALIGDFASLLSLNGYVKIPTPNGTIIVQGFTATLTENTLANVISYPISFPTAALWFTSSLGSMLSVDVGYTVGIDANNTSSCLVSLTGSDSGSGTLGCHFIVIGH